jgi:hypothetical protein
MASAALNFEIIKLSGCWISWAIPAVRSPMKPVFRLNKLGLFMVDLLIKHRWSSAGYEQIQRKSCEHHGCEWFTPGRFSGNKVLKILNTAGASKPEEKKYM